MAYNINNFVKVVSKGDRNLQIVDSNGTVKYSINPYHVLNVLQNNNLLKINLKSGRFITLDFSNSTEAIESVLTLQNKIDELVTVTPFTIDKDVENWVEDVNLITPTGETLSIWGDLLPGTTSTYNIGSLEYEWHTLYVGSQSLVVGGVTISSASGSIMMSSMNLGNMDNPLILTYDGINLLTNGTTSNFSGHYDTNKLVNGDLELSLDEKGTLNFPTLLPVSFTAVCDTEHIIGTYSPFADENWWEFEVEFSVNPNGSVETIINNIFPILTNPGYESGNSFRFTSIDHGIPNFDFDIILDDVVFLGATGWDSSLVVSQPPTYPSTISSQGNLKFTSNTSNTFLFGDKFYIEGVDYLSKGGTLSQTLQIDSDNNDYLITGADNLLLSSSVFSVEANFVSLESNESGQILVGEDLSILTGGQLVIIGSSSNITIAGGQGLVYTQDYSPTFVDNSLVTKKFVLDNIGSGATGPMGVTGPEGPIGVTGAEGPIGVTGPEGPIGVTGPEGPMGVTGPEGPMGVTGPEGPMGVTGPEGPMGVTGPSGISPAVEIQAACSDETTALTTGTAKVTFRMPYAMTVYEVRASLTTAQASGSIFTVDINESGTSILSTKLTIDNTEKTSKTAATPAVISDGSLADDAEITVDIDQIGNGTATGLKITLIGVRS